MDATRLITDIKDNNIDAVQSALIQEPSLVSKEALFCAAQKGNLEILRFLVEYSRISLNEYDDDHICIKRTATIIFLKQRVEPVPATG